MYALCTLCRRAAAVYDVGRNTATTATAAAAEEEPNNEQWYIIIIFMKYQNRQCYKLRKVKRDRNKNHLKDNTAIIILYNVCHVYKYYKLYIYIYMHKRLPYDRYSDQVFRIRYYMLPLRTYLYNIT